MFSCQAMSDSFVIPMNCCLPGYSVYGISQARILEWVAISYSKGSSQPRSGTYISCISRWVLYHWATSEDPCDKVDIEKMKKVSQRPLDSTDKRKQFWFQNLWLVMVLKTLESPLDSKEIEPVNPKGNQCRIFIGRTDTEAEAPIHRPPDVKNWLIWKDRDTRKDWGQEEKGMTEDEIVG